MLEAWIAYLRAHALYISLLSLVVGAIVRGLKSDKIPDPIAKVIQGRVRFWLAAALAQGLSAIIAVIAGTTWQVAMINGVMGMFVAVGGHDSIVELLRQGRELFDSGDGKPKPPTAILGGLIVLVLVLTGCGWFTPRHVQDVGALTRCAFAHEGMPPEDIAAICGLENADVVVDLFAAQREAAAKHRAALCGPGDATPAMAP